MILYDVPSDIARNILDITFHTFKEERRDTRGTISPRRNGHLWYLKFGTLVHARGRATTCATNGSDRSEKTRAHGSSATRLRRVLRRIYVSTKVRAGLTRMETMESLYLFAHTII